MARLLTTCWTKSNIHSTVSSASSWEKHLALWLPGCSTVLTSHSVSLALHHFTLGRKPTIKLVCVCVCVCVRAESSCPQFKMRGSLRAGVTQQRGPANQNSELRPPGAADVADWWLQLLLQTSFTSRRVVSCLTEMIALPCKPRALNLLGFFFFYNLPYSDPAKQSEEFLVFLFKTLLHWSHRHLPPFFMTWGRLKQ